MLGSREPFARVADERILLSLVDACDGVCMIGGVPDAWARGFCGGGVGGDFGVLFLASGVLLSAAHAFAFSLARCGGVGGGFGLFGEADEGNVGDDEAALTSAVGVAAARSLSILFTAFSSEPSLAAALSALPKLNLFFFFDAFDTFTAAGAFGAGSGGWTTSEMIQFF